MGGGLQARHTARRYSWVMSQKIWTAEELERMPAAEQDAIFDASMVRNLDDLPEQSVAKVRARFEAHLAGNESPAQ